MVLLLKTFDMNLEQLTHWKGE